MTQQYGLVQGIDYTLPDAPPLTDAPLSLIGEATPLINLEGLVARRQEAAEKAASANAQLEMFDRLGIVGDDDLPGAADSLEDARKALEQQASEWNSKLASLDTMLKDQQRFEHGFLYLPEISNADGMSLFAPDSFDAIGHPTQGAIKPDASNQQLFAWYDPFVAVALDKRSAFGWPAASYEARAARVLRALRAHEGWQVENEFWGGATIPTNYHLTASSHSVLSAPHRTLGYAFPDPTPAPTTVLGTAVGLKQSLESLDQAVADSDAGVGMIHATPYVMQAWMSQFGYLRDSQGRVRTVNNNILVPGYGYGGTGPDQATRTVADAVFNSTTLVTSATAAFTAFDIGMPMTGAGIPAGAVIVTVDSGTNVHLSVATTATGSGRTIVLPGYGGRSTGSLKQWAYATDSVFHCQGDAMTYPFDLRELSPALPVDNDVPVRAERTHAMITNKLLRAAVLVDTTQA